MFRQPPEADVVLFLDPEHGYIAHGADKDEVTARLASAAGFTRSPADAHHHLPTSYMPPRQAAGRVTSLARALIDAGYTVRIDSTIPDAKSPLPPDLSPLADAFAALAAAVETTPRPDEVRQLLENIAGDDGPIAALMDLLDRIAERCADYPDPQHQRTVRHLRTAPNYLHGAGVSIRAATRLLPSSEPPVRHTPTAARPTTAPPRPSQPTTAPPPRR